MAKSGPLKVLHLINTLSAGGAELHLLTLCRHQKRLGLEVTVACLREQVRDSRSLRPDFEQAGIRVIDLRARSRYNWQFLARTPLLLRRERFDLLHTHLPRADLAGLAAKLIAPEITWVCSVHGMYKSWSGNRILFLFSRVWGRADAMIAVSHAVKDWLEQERCLPPEKVAVIRYGIEPAHFSPAKARQRKRNGSAVIGSLGRLEYRKGHHILIEAMPLILRQEPRARLLIAGHDPEGYGRTLKDVIRQLGLREQVALAGFQRDVPGFLKSIDVFAFASLSEGFGQVLIEAMAAGRPVVATRIPPLTEIVRDGETGLLADMNDPHAFAQGIIRLLRNPEKAEQLGKAGMRRVQRFFSAERMSRETFRLYKRVLDQ
ncbi:MAG: glycosyltransferase family 4 protein [Deltaproteobacteria bacterium]|nr:glycosyltransferase family 4 protein [Deltaproteobacteria bacterium]